MSEPPRPLDSGTRQPGSRAWEPGRLALRRAVTLLLAATLACQDPAPADRLEVGDSLIDRADLLVVEQRPRTVLPDAVAAELLSGDTRARIRPEDWRALSPEAVHADLLPMLVRLKAAFSDGLGDDVTCWVATPRLPACLGLGRTRLRHEERPTSHLQDYVTPIGDAPGRPPWLDGEGHTVFLWDGAESRLSALASRRPGTVELALDSTHSPRLMQFERLLMQDAADDGGPGDPHAGGAAAPAAHGGDHAGAPATPSAPDRARDGPHTHPTPLRLVLAGAHRDALTAPAGTTLAIDLARFPADTERLALAVGLSELSSGEGLVGPGGEGLDSDGLEFEVRHRHDGRTTTLWQRRVDPGQGWHEDLVRLPAERAGQLLLVTHAGAGGDPTFDYGAWGDLRLLPAAPRRPTRPHVILIDVDTLRADRLGCYGYERPTSPRIDAWAAAHAEVYLDATSTSNWTLPATLSMLTGLDVAQHGVADVSRALGEDVPTLAERLAAAGYDTWARSDGGYVVPAFAFDRGFDLFVVDRPDEEQRLESGWKAELERLATRRSGRPVFYFLQTYQVHSPFPPDRRFDDAEDPYLGRFDRPHFNEQFVQNAVTRGRPPSPRERRWVEDQYDGAVRRMDDVVGRFLEQLDGALGGDPALVVLTSDHGEEVLDRGWYGHRHSLHRELLQVPLIVQHPLAGRVGSVRAPTSLLDIVPTVLDHAGLPRPTDLPGLSLAEPLPPDRLRLAMHEDFRFALHVAGHKLILDRSGDGDGDAARLYALAADPGEQVDLSERESERVELLVERLDAYLEENAPRGNAAAPPLDEALLRDLEALGYLERGG